MELPIVPAYPLREFGAADLNVAAFDTHAFVKRLTAVGMPEPQAEALADEQRRLIDDRLATKEDIARLEGTTRTEIARLEGATRTEIARLELVTKAETARLEAATKSDIARLEAATKSDVARLEAEIDRLGETTKANLAETKFEILKWVIGTMGFQTLLILGSVFAMVKWIHG